MWVPPSCCSRFTSGLCSALGQDPEAGPGVTEGEGGDALHCSGHSWSPSANRGAGAACAGMSRAGLVSPPSADALSASQISSCCCAEQVVSVGRRLWGCCSAREEHCYHCVIIVGFWKLGLKGNPTSPRTCNRFIHVGSAADTELCLLPRAGNELLTHFMPI